MDIWVEWWFIRAGKCSAKGNSANLFSKGVTTTYSAINHMHVSYESTPTSVLGIIRFLSLYQ